MKPGNIQNCILEIVFVALQLSNIGKMKKVLKVSCMA